MKRLALSLLLLSVVVLWGWTFVLVKDAIRAYGLLPFNAIRYVIATAAMGLFTAWRIDWRSLKVGALIGPVLAAAYLLQPLGLDRTSATSTGIITGLFIVFVPLSSRALFGLRTAGVVWVAIGVSVVGLALLSGGAPQGMAFGDVLTLAGAACFGLHIALLGRYAKGRDASVLALGQIGAAMAVFLAACPLAAGPLAWPTPRVWFALLVTGIGATAVAFYVQTFVQQRLPAVQTAMIILLEPLFAALFGYLLAGDRLNGLQVLGAALITGSVFVAELYPLLRRARPSPLVQSSSSSQS